MKTFVINLKTWYRGHGSEGSRLRRKKDGKQCCLGFYLRSCGLKAKQIEEATMPYRVATLVPDEAQWLLSSSAPHYEGSRAANRLASANDNQNVSETERKKRVKKLFADHHVKVVFK